MDIQKYTNESIDLLLNPKPNPFEFLYKKLACFAVHYFVTLLATT